jgi:hypothetical protein
MLRAVALPPETPPATLLFRAGTSGIDVHLSGWVLWPVVAVILVLVIVSVARRRTSLRRFEIDEAELGIGKHKVVLRPNVKDLQIAFQLWVELSTRKLGLAIDLENDVITEIYNSWYAFFGTARELIKGIPADSLRRKDTRRIAELSVEVLNSGVRPHLTAWQARFRRWYAAESQKPENASLSPQELQRRFPEYGTLSTDMLRVNRQLIQYRTTMYRLLDRGSPRGGVGS